jgi:hypothetical protein
MQLSTICRRRRGEAAKPRRCRTPRVGRWRPAASAGQTARGRRLTSEHRRAGVQLERDLVEGIDLAEVDPDAQDSSSLVATLSRCPRSATAVAGSVRTLPQLSCRFHRRTIEILAYSTDALPPIAAGFHGFSAFPQGYHASNLAGRQPSPFCCCFPLFACPRTPASGVSRHDRPGFHRSKGTTRGAFSSKANAVEWRHSEP